MVATGSAGLRPQQRGISRHAVWLVPIAILSLLPILAMKMLVGGRFGQMEDKLGEAQEMLLESQEHASDLERALAEEKSRRARIEEQLAQVRKEKEASHLQIVKQQHAIGKLATTSRTELSEATAKVRDLQAKLDEALMQATRAKEKLAAQKTHESRAVNSKSDQLESYHQLIVSQRKEIERKNAIITRFADDRSRAASAHRKREANGAVFGAGSRSSNVSHATGRARAEMRVQSANDTARSTRRSSNVSTAAGAFVQ